MTTKVTQDCLEKYRSIQQIKVQKTSIADFVQLISDKLTSENTSEREASLRDLINVVLCQNPTNNLTSKEVQSLLDFFFAKLDDHVIYTDVPLLKAIHYLIIESRQLGDGLVAGIFKHLFEDVSVQSLPQEDRYYLFDILNFLLENRADELRQMGPEFILGFMRAIDSERDPRCLLQTLHLFREIASTYPIGPFASDLFDLMACYFPIDFKPPENDLYGITAGQLSKSLNACLIVHPSFASLYFDLIQEKLSDDGVTHEKKLEIFEFLVTALKKFEPSAVKYNADGLWDAIKADVFNPEHIVSKQVLEAISQLIVTVKILSDSTGISSDLDDLIEKILNSCEPFVLQAEIGKSAQGLSVLEAVAKTDKYVCQKVAHSTIPWLIELAQGSTVSSVNRTEISNEMIPHLSKWCEMVFEMNCDSVLSAGLSDALLHLCSESFCTNRSLSSVTTGFDLARIILKSCSIEDFGEKFEKVAHLAIKAVTLFDKCDLVRESALMYLRQLSVRNWSWFEHKLWQQLQNSGVIERCIIFAYAINDSESANILLPHLEHALLLKTNWDESCQIELILPYLAKIFWLNRCDRRAVDLCLDHLLPVLTELSLTAQCARISECLQDISLQLDQSHEARLITRLCNYLRDASRERAIILLPTFLLPLISSNYQNTLLISETIEILETKLGHSNDIDLILCSIINKCDVLWKKELKKMDRSDISTEAISALTRALILSDRQPNANHLLTKLFADLAVSDSIECVNKCRGIFNLSSRFSDINKCRFKTTFLWKQRMISQIVPVFLANFESVQQDSSLCDRFFQVLAELLTFIDSLDTCTVTAEISKLAPMLLSALQSNMPPKTAEDVLGAVAVLFQSKNCVQLLDDKVTSLVDRLIYFSTDTHINIHIKLIALKCLKALRQILDSTKLIQMQLIVFRGLTKAVNDKKRLVRREAADTRNIWSII